MIETAPGPIPFKPQSVIVITGFNARLDAIKALLGVILTHTPLLAAANYTAAKQILTARKDAQALVVMDGWSLDDPSILEIHALREDFPGVRFLLITENFKDSTGSRHMEAYEVLDGRVSGNQFIHVIREMLDNGS